MLNTIIQDCARNWSFPPNNLFSVLKSVKFPCGFWGRKNTKVELTFFFFLREVPLIPPYKYEGIDVWGQNCLGPTLDQWTSSTSQSNNKKVCPLNADQNEGPGLSGGCRSWAMVCWTNTRSVCRICQINFNSERIWAINTQEIAWLGHDQSFKRFEGGGGGDGGDRRKAKCVREAELFGLI